MKLTRLTELARRLGVSVYRLRTQLLAVEHDRRRRGRILVQVGHHKTRWVNESELAYLNGLAKRGTEKRIARLEQRVRVLEARVDDHDGAIGR